jgi:HEAT repeat protein
MMTMPVLKPIPFPIIIAALLDENTPFNPRYLNRLSDLEPADVSLLTGAWSRVSLRRRQALLEDLEEVHMADDLLCFEEVGRVALNDNDPGVRMRAVRILREYELVDLLPAFINLAEHDVDAEVRAASAAALATYIYMGEVEDLAQKKVKRVEECLLHLATASDDMLTRRKALEALGFSSREEVVPLIEKAYRSVEIDWLISALFAMGRSANPRWNTHVLKMLDHKRPAVRAEAASAAGELEITDAVPQLLELLEDPDLDVRMASIWALSQVGGEGVQEALENMLENTDDDEEVNQLGNALENLDFTNEMRDLVLFELTEGEEDEESSLDAYDADIDDLNAEDDEV